MSTKQSPLHSLDIPALQLLVRKKQGGYDENYSIPGAEWLTMFDELPFEARYRIIKGTWNNYDSEEFKKLTLIAFLEQGAATPEKKL